ncbi:L-threonine 3-dehydrogenase [bacterium]|nr:L-threonine 3-dehydrogenase [bacterium]
MKMKALVKKYPKEGLWMEEVDIPKPGVNDVLVKIKKTAICGTDLHIYNWDEWSQRTIKTPMTIGHEYVGTVVEVGAGVRNIEVGDRVTGEGHITCGVCRNCRMGRQHLCPNTIGVGVNRDGAFAEYLSVPGRNLIKVHPEISDEIASIFDPFGNATHAALSFPLIGEDVLITGSGLIGSMAVAICRFVGARYVVTTDLSDYRLDLAKKMGATMAINPTKTSLKEAIKSLNMANGFDVGLEMSGSPKAFNDMLEHMYHGSHIALLGILPKGTGINWDDVIFKGLILKGIYGREMYETWYKMEQMVRSGLDISPIITHRYKVDSFLEAFEVMKSGQSGKIILDWN